MADTGSQQRRTDLLEQMRYLIDEVTALREVMSRMHESQITNTERGPSVKQRYGAIIMRDSNELLPALKKLVGVKRTKKKRNRDWNQIPLEEILSELKSARQSVVETILSLDETHWNQEITSGINVYQLLLNASHKDADTLREIAQLLYRDFS
ncbi:MAG: hypothetical protein OXF06_02370 [Bacteroidetes bacterium]|nr:hypothetical protein [Bacteroidota bacterium]